MFVTLLLFAALQAPPVAKAADTLAWDYLTADQQTGGVTEFLVCVDNQVTAACAIVPALSAPPTASTTYTWKLPALTLGPHTVAVQACTAGAAACASGVTLPFTFVVIPNASNLRLVKAGGV